MKKRLLSSAIILSLILCNLPLSVSAATVNKSMTNSITNVRTKITLTGTRYFTYNFNGMQVDSRNVGAKWNVKAFENMSPADKNKVAMWYLPGKDRTEQFGKSGVEKVIKHINEKSGWASAWTVMRNRIGNKYLSELRPFYGGNETEGDPDSFYDDEIVRLTSYSEGTAAYRVFNEYGSYKESEEIILLNASIPEMMEVGKTAYNTCVNAYYQSISAGTKALSTYTIGLIVDNCIVPGTFMTPSATMAGVRTASYTLILTARNFIRDSVSKITGYSETYIDELARTAVAGGSGASPDEAVDIIKKQKVIIDENYKLAKYCHDQAVLFRQTIDSKAQSVINQIEANNKKKDERHQTELANKESREDAVKTVTGGLTHSGNYYSRIMAKKPTADPNKDPDLYDSQYNAYCAEIETCKNEFDNEYKTWKTGVSSSYDAIIGSTNFYEWWNHSWQNMNMENYNSGDIPDDDKMQEITTEANDIIQFYQSAKTSRDQMISSLKSLYESKRESFAQLYSRGMGINDAGGNADLSTYRINGENTLISIVDEQIYIERYKDGFNVNNDFADEGKDYFDVRINHIRDNMALLNSRRADYKKMTEKRLDDYLKLQEIDDTARAEYNKAVKERNELLDNLPDYVENQAVSNYNFTLIQYDVDTTDLFTLNSGNSVLKNKINEATADLDRNDPDFYNKYNKAKNVFFKQEADKLEPIYDKIRAIDRKLEQLEGVTGAFNTNHVMWRIRYNNNLEENNLERYGIKPKNMHYGTAEDFDKSWYTSAYDKKKTAMKLLISDFRGMGNMHLKFIDAYNNTKTARSTSVRAVAGGAMSAYDFRSTIYSPLNSAYFDFKRSSSVPTFSGPNINIGEEDELELQTMFDDEDSEIQKLLEISENPEDYVPVEGLQTGISVMSDAIDINEGDSIKLNVSVVPANATFPKIYWESLNPDIVQVDKNGNITALCEGTAVIRAVADDAPITEVKDENENVIAYEVPDEFVMEFTINAGNKYSFNSVGNDGYQWANFGTAGKPQYTKSETKDGKTTVFARFNSEGTAASVIMAVYDKNNKLIAVSVTENYEEKQDIAVTFDSSKNADRIKIMTWYGTESMKPYASTVIEEEIK